MNTQQMLKKLNQVREVRGIKPPTSVERITHFENEINKDRSVADYVKRESSS